MLCFETLKYGKKKTQRNYSNALASTTGNHVRPLQKSCGPFLIWRQESVDCFVRTVRTYT